MRGRMKKIVAFFYKNEEILEKIRKSIDIFPKKEYNICEVSLC